MLAGRAVRLITALLLTGAAAATVLARATPALAITPVVGPLSTSGTQILNGNGQPITLRGVNVEWLDWEPYVWSSPTDTPLDPHNLSNMPNWGANTNGTGGINVVRVFLGEQYWNPDNCDYISSYEKTVETVVSQITSEGMVALLDLHHNTRIPCGDPTDINHQAAQQDMADSDSLLFWTSVAETFKSNPLVAFDLYNEPHLYQKLVDGKYVNEPAVGTSGPPDWQVWLDGGQVEDGDLVWTAVGMQQMYDAIRATGATNLIFVDGNDYSNIPPPSTSLVSGNNIVYAEHAYTCLSLPCPTGSTNLPSSVNNWTSFYTQQPTMITEFGYPDTTDGTYNQNVINWAESNRVGWIAYSWYDNGGASSGLGFLTDLSSDDPTASGLPVQTGMSKNN
jgi:endoglucanase